VYICSTRAPVPITIPRQRLTGVTIDGIERSVLRGRVSSASVRGTRAHFAVVPRNLPLKIRADLGLTVYGHYYGTIQRLLGVFVDNAYREVAYVQMYRGGRMDPKTRLACVAMSRSVSCWILVTHLGKTVALGRGAPGVVGTGHLLWTVIDCVPSQAHCTVDGCVCGQ
jgi:hypothetical protein